MLKASNSKEQISAFIQFIVIFLAALVLLLIVAFIGVKIPTSEVNHYKSEANELKSQFTKQQKVVAEIGKIDSIFSKAERPEDFTKDKEVAIDEALTQVNALAADSTLKNTQLFMMMKRSYSKWVEDKKSLKEMAKSNKEIRDKLQDSEKEKDKMERQLQMQVPPR